MNCNNIRRIELRFYLTVLLLILKKPHLASAEGAPRKLALADGQRIIFKHINETLELTCPIDTSDTKTFVEWSKGNESLYMKPGYEINKKGVLRIKSVAMKHAGTYTCEAVNGYGFVQVELNVIVDKPEVGNVDDIPINPNSVNRVHFSQPSIKKRPTVFIDDVGGQATFHCVATGQPTPHIFWFKNGVQNKSAETETSKGKVHSTLKLRGLQMNDAGIYKCIARNIVGKDHLDFNLQVTEIPKPPRILSLEPAFTTIKEGEAALFWCEVDSKPGLKLHIRWLKKLSKEEITDSVILDDLRLFRSGANFYRPLPNATNTLSGLEGRYKSRLLIKNSCKEDSGTYVCLALNDKGFNFKNVSLTVVNTALKPYPGHSGHFSTSDTSLIVIVIIALVIVLATIVLVTQLYCRNSSQKTSASKRVFFDQECVQDSTYLKKTGKKTYPELNDPQSKSNLLCSNSTCGFETENKFQKQFM